METRSSSLVAAATSLSGVSVKVSVEIAAERAPLASHALRIQVRASLPGAKVSSSRDQDTARSLEDAMVQTIQGRLGGLYGGWVLVERAVVFQFFLPTALETEAETLVQVVEGLVSEKGALLAPVTRIVGNGSASNDTTGALGTTATTGTEAPRPLPQRDEILHVVEHTAFFANATRAALAAHELGASGFHVEAPFLCRVVDPLTPAGVLRHCVRASRAETLSRSRIDDFTREIRGMIRAHAGEYDGWTSASRPPMQLRAARHNAGKVIGKSTRAA